MPLPVTDDEILAYAKSLGVPHDQPLSATLIAERFGWCTRYARCRVRLLRQAGRWPWPYAVNRHKPLLARKPLPPRIDPATPEEIQARKATVDQTRWEFWCDPSVEPSDMAEYHRRLDVALGDTIGCTAAYREQRSRQTA